MFELILKESKMIGKSLVYLILIAVIFFFYDTQFYEEMPVTKNLESNSYRTSLDEPVYVNDLGAYFSEHHEYPYGTITEENSELIIEGAIKSLLNEYNEGKYLTYPMGFAKYIKLNDRETNRMKKILQEITGKTITELNEINISGKLDEVLAAIDIKYDKFQELMEEGSSIIGSNSYYSEENLKKLGERPKTYEEAMNDYRVLLEKDKITNAYARLFCDYLGMVLGLFPVFLVVYYMLRDNRSNMYSLIYCKKISSFKLIISRYIALVTMIMLPVILFALLATGKFIAIGSELKLSIDYLAFIKYSLAWLMPTVMIVTALGIFLTVLTDSIMAIIIQILWFSLSLYTSGLMGNYDIMQLMIRFNTIGSREILLSNLNQILINRLFLIVLSIALLVASAYALNLKREGRINIYDRFKEYFSALQSKLQASFSK